MDEKTGPVKGGSGEGVERELAKLQTLPGERALAVRAFAQGFADGADPQHARRRHQVDAATHAHWRKGFEAGKAAATSAAYEFTMSLVRARKPATEKVVSEEASAALTVSSCTCYHTCERDSHSGDWHQHEDEPCPVHPDAPVVG